MSATNEHAVHVLNSLIETTLDSANGYREAAENIDDSRLKTMFAERSKRRMDLARELQDQVRACGGTPDTDQSLVGKAHNKFVDLKNAITGGSDKAVINEVERGEDVIKAKFERAAEDQQLPSAALQAITRASQLIRQDHDQVSALKHSAQ